MKIRVTYSAIFFTVLVPFMLTTGTGFGAYSSQFGPYWFVMLLACAGAMYSLRPVEFIHVTMKPQAMLGGAFFFALIAAAAFTREGRELHLMMPMIAQFICYLLALCLVTRFVPSMSFAWVCLTTLLLSATVNVYEYFISPQLFSVSPGRAAGFFVNPNNSANAVGLLAFLALAVGNWRSQLMVALIMMISGVAIVITFSRGGIVIFVALMLLVFAMRQVDRNRPIAGMILLAMMAGFASWLLARLGQSALSEDASMRLESLLTGDFSDGSVRSREESLNYYVRLILDNPVFGSKPFGSLYEVQGQGPHNSFVALGADFGIFALAVPLLMIALCVWRAKRLRWRGPEAMTLLGLAVWMLLASMSSHNVFYSSFGALVAGLAMGMLSSNTGRKLSDEHGRS
jgi:O-antigen ligase